MIGSFACMRCMYPWSLEATELAVLHSRVNRDGMYLVGTCLPGIWTTRPVNEVVRACLPIISEADVVYIATTGNVQYILNVTAVHV